MFGTDFCKKCIIMHFLGTEKERKKLSTEVSGAEFAETQRKDLGKDESEEKDREGNGRGRRHPGPPKGGPYEVG
jgi:hypothetical protein